MSFIQQLDAGVRKHMANLKAMHDRRVQEAETRARADIAHATTKLEQERAKLKLVREKLALKRELYEARLATRQAKAAMNKARIEAGDLSIGERLGKIGKDIGSSPLAKDFARAGKRFFTEDKPQRVVAKRRVTRKKAR